MVKINDFVKERCCNIDIQNLTLSKFLLTKNVDYHHLWTYNKITYFTTQ
jgi:hypothetical protein